MAQLHSGTERVKGEVVKPTATLQVIEAMGVSRAARKIGVSTTLLHKARKPNAVVSRVVEIAAQSVLNDAHGTAQSAVPTELNGAAKHPAIKVQEPVLMLLEVPADKARIIERLCKAMGAKFVEA